MEKTLGEKIRELRDEKDISLRYLAKQLKVSAPFMSDVELGRRFPSEEKLAKIAVFFRISLDELRQYDSRPPLSDMKRMADANPQWGFAFRTVVEDAKKGVLTAEKFMDRLRNAQRSKKK